MAAARPTEQVRLGVGIGHNKPDPSVPAASSPAERLNSMLALRHLCAAALFLSVGVLPSRAQTALYQPIPIPPGTNEVSGRLTDRDIPTGEGGFARDYKLQLQAGDRLTIDAFSDNFDTLLLLIGADGSVVAENDDGPDGSTNSLLFARIDEAGDYIVRIRSFGETGGGSYTLTITRLRPVE